MHRTQSLDYGIILEARIEMELDTGEKHILTCGDVAVQRATMHAWQNVSDTECARMVSYYRIVSLSNSQVSNWRRTWTKGESRYRRAATIND
jgi:hypothetical protein